MLWWFLGIPFGSVFAPWFLTFSPPGIDMLIGMVVVLAGMGLLARRALSY
jgi:hypothetical protein